jgi:nucleotide-binding universal stress UspA family protein
MANTILYPTRGGPSSYPNQDLVITLAKDRGSELVFMYVSSVHFLDHFASPLLVDIETSLDEMGEFLLAMAQERAKKAGMKARTVVRHGEFREILEEEIRKQGATTVVLGSPSEETGVTTQKYLRKLTQLLVENMGVEVFLVDNGAILEQEQPNENKHNK